MQQWRLRQLRWAPKYALGQSFLECLGFSGPRAINDAFPRPSWQSSRAYAGASATWSGDALGPSRGLLRRSNVTAIQDTTGRRAILPRTARAHKTTNGNT